MRRGEFDALIDRLRELAKDDPATLQDLREVESMSAVWDFDGEGEDDIEDDDGHGYSPTSADFHNDAHRPPGRRFVRGDE